MDARPHKAQSATRPRGRLLFRLAAETGSSVTEFALMVPILVAILMWLIYFWEMQQARIKAAEAARFLAFEGVVDRDAAAAAREARERWMDLDGSTRNVAQGAGYWNRLTIEEATLTEVPSPLSSASLDDAGRRAGIGGLLGEATKVLGSALNPVVRKLGFDPSRGGGSRGRVAFRMENRILPRRINEYMVAQNLGTLDLVFRDQFEVFSDTWRAWKSGDVPSANPQDPTVWDNVHARTKNLAYLGISTPDEVGNIIRATLQLDWPFDNSYKRAMVKIGGPGVPGNYSAGGAQTWLMPGQKVTACYWTGNDSCSSGPVSSVRTTRNFHMRAYNCRGKFFGGTTKSGMTEWEYSVDANKGGRLFNISNSACTR
jgi:hypothetical protein